MVSTRRSFVKWVGFSGVVILVPACRTREGLSKGLEDETPPPSIGDIEKTVTMQDILMEGWSTLGSGFLGNNGPLSVKRIQENKTLMLTYIQDPHGHKFKLTPDHFAKLRKGKIVDILTTEALGHKHIVRINPARIIASSTKIIMPIEIPSGDEPLDLP